MTAAAQDRMNTMVSSTFAEFQCGIFATETLYMNCMAAALSASGYLVAGGVAATGPILGVVKSRKANTAAGAANGDVSADLLQGLFWFDNHTTAVRQQDVGLPCYAKDDQAVSRSSADGPMAGLALAVSTTQGVLVFVHAAMNKALSQSATALQTMLASILNTEGASMIGVEDAAGNFAVADDVEACLADIFTQLASVATGFGASLIGVDNVATKFATANVETCLNECALTLELASIAAGVSGASLIGVEDAGHFTTQATVEACIAQIYQDLLTHHEALHCSLYNLREVSGGGDVGNIAANGGILASDTTPVLRGNAAETQEIYWAAGNSDIVAMHWTLPEDFDDTKDAFVDLYVSTDNTNADPANFTVETGWDGGALVSDVAVDAAAAAVHKITVTIANADIPAGAANLTLMLTPPAHATDGIALSGFRVRYSRKLLTS